MGAFGGRKRESRNHITIISKVTIIAIEKN